MLPTSCEPCWTGSASVIMNVHSTRLSLHVLNCPHCPAIHTRGRQFLSLASVPCMKFSVRPSVLVDRPLHEIVVYFGGKLTRHKLIAIQILFSTEFTSWIISLRYTEFRNLKRWAFLFTCDSFLFFHSLTRAASFLIFKGFFFLLVNLCSHSLSWQFSVNCFSLFLHGSVIGKIHSCNHGSNIRW